MHFNRTEISYFWIVLISSVLHVKANGFNKCVCCSGFGDFDRVAIKYFVICFITFF